ncbi:Uncharacterised protein [Mycobacterium tuberculosis]|nr:Uncharacterised protein [Mycobacterium tuberculosis]
MIRSGVTNSIVERRGPALSTSACATPILRWIAMSLRHAPATRSTDCSVTKPVTIRTAIRNQRSTILPRVSGSSSLRP